MAQGSVLDSVLHLLYPCDLPKLENNTYTDGTAIMAVGNSNTESTEEL